MGKPRWSVVGVPGWMEHLLALVCLLLWQVPSDCRAATQPEV